MDSTERSFVLVIVVIVGALAAMVVWGITYEQRCKTKRVQIAAECAERVADTFMR